MDKLMTLGIALTAIDKFTKPMEKVQKNIGAFSKKISKTKIDNLSKGIEDVESKISRLNSLKLKLEHRLKRSKKNADSLRHNINRVTDQLSKLNQKKLNLTNDLKHANTEAKYLDERMKRFGLTMTKYGALTAAAGRIATNKLKSTVLAFKDLEKAQGDLLSVGMSEKGTIPTIEAGKKMMRKYAGVMVDEFAKAAYDIKSGISTLSDDGVAAFTEMATLTARATKSSSEEMTKLFALGHGIFKRMDESDFDFGKRFSAGIAGAVQIFRTEGSDLTQAISSVGSVAHAMGVSFEEELAVLGTAKKSFKDGAEAGTSYRAFLSSAVQAQQKLGISMTDTHGKLLPMRMILEQIKKKFGDLNAMEMKEIKDAFGSEEAVKIITALIEKTDMLAKSEKKLKSANLSDVRSMAQARNKGREYELMLQRLSLVSIAIGEKLSPVFNKLAKWIGKISAKIEAFINGSQLGKWTVYTAAVLSVLALTLGTVGLAVGAFTAYIGFAGKALSLFSVLSKAGAIGMVFLQAAMSPVVLIAAAIAGVVYLIIDNWGALAAWFSQLWQGISSIFESAASWITLLMSNPVEAISVAWASLVSWFGSFWDSVKALYTDGASYIGNIFTSPVKWIKSVWFDLLAWLGKKIDSIKGVVNAVSRFVGQGDVFKIGVDASGAPDSKDGAFVAKAKNSDTSQKTLSALKDIADNTSLKRPKIADFVPTKKIKHGKISGGNRGKRSGSSAGTDSIRSSAASGGRGGNAYTINIRILGNEPADIAVKLKSLLPSLIKDIEQNTLARGMYDL